MQSEINNDNARQENNRKITKSLALIRKDEFRLIKDVLDRKKINMGILSSKDNQINSLRMEALKKEQKCTKEEMDNSILKI